MLGYNYYNSQTLRSVVETMSMGEKISASLCLLVILIIVVSIYYWSQNNQSAKQNNQLVEAVKQGNTPLTKSLIEFTTRHFLCRRTFDYSFPASKSTGLLKTGFDCLIIGMPTYFCPDENQVVLLNRETSPVRKAIEYQTKIGR